jgi:hypothetical protein
LFCFSPLTLILMQELVAKAKDLHPKVRRRAPKALHQTMAYVVSNSQAMQSNCQQQDIVLVSVEQLQD